MRAQSGFPPFIRDSLDNLSMIVIATTLAPLRSLRQRLMTSLARRVSTRHHTPDIPTSGTAYEFSLVITALKLEDDEDLQEIQARINLYKSQEKTQKNCASAAQKEAKGSPTAYRHSY